MLNGNLLVSAPYPARSTPSYVAPSDEFVPFQALLGWDAHIIRLAGHAQAAGGAVRFLAAPELCSASDRRLLGLAGEADRCVHLRFGTPRLPGILKGAINMAVLTEDASLPTEAGLRPFASGTVFPQAMVAALSHRGPRAMAARRIDGAAIPIVKLPKDWLDDPSAGIRPSTSQPGGAAGPALDDDVVCQPCHGLLLRDWVRRPMAQPAAPIDWGGPGRGPAGSPAVLVPWNLAHPGSLVPDLIDKAVLLSAQGRQPVTLIVMPYNDAPAGFMALRRFASASDRPVEAQFAHALPLFVRARTVAAGQALVASCRRVWMDATDPEWWSTTRTLRRLGLPVNFVSEAPAEHQRDHDPGPLRPDEDITVRSATYGPLAWRSRCLSVRRLGELAAAVARDADSPAPALAGGRPGAAPSNPIQAIWDAAEAHGRG